MSRSARWTLIILCVCALPVMAQERDRYDRDRRGDRRDRIAEDASRLAAELHDLQYERVRFEPGVWRSSANEAMALANRLYDEAGGRPEANEIRLRIRRLRSEVGRGDYDDARRIAADTMPFVHRLSEWARRDERR